MQLLPHSLCSGRERSRTLEDVLREARDLAAHGYRELVLTGVNIGQYSYRGATLVDLLRELETIPDVTRLRISSIEPTTVPAALLELMAASPKLCRYLHLPLQSGDDAILQAMNRRYSVREYEELVEQALKLMPDLGLGTDVMVGFPSEDEQAFANTVRMAERAALLLSPCFQLFIPTRHCRGSPGGPDSASSHPPTQQDLSRTVPNQDNRLLSGSDRPHRLSSIEQGERDGFRSGTTANFTRVAVPADAVVAGSIHHVTITGIMDGWHMAIQPLPSWNLCAVPYYDHETARQTPSGPYRNLRLPDERVRLGARPVLAPQSRVSVYRGSGTRRRHAHEYLRIRENAHNKVYGHLAELKAVKEQRPLVVGVLGCMAQNLKEELTDKQPLVDVLVGPDGYRQLPGLLLNALNAR